MPDFSLNDYAPDPAFPCHIEEMTCTGDVPLHGHRDFTEIVFVRGGSALHRSGVEEYLLRRGDVLVADEGAVHGFFQPRDFRLCFLRFRLDALIPPQADLLLSPGFRALFLPQGRGADAPRRLLHPESAAWHRLETALDAALEEYRRQQPGYRTCLQGQLTAMLVHLARLFEAQGPAQAASGGAERALAYLEDHFTEEIALSELARIAGISPRHLDRVFSETYRLTPRAYMTRLRMARAKTMLGTDRPITEIAFDCGYADSNYFSQVFRRYTGMTPQQYRRGAKGK